MLQKYEEMGDCSEERMNELLQDVVEIQDILEHSGFYMIDAITGGTHRDFDYWISVWKRMLPC